MPRKRKIFFLIILVSFFLFHFTLIFFYLLKPNCYSTFYAYPYFHQNWNLFAPAPECNYNLYVFEPGKKGSGTDILAEITARHQRNRLNGQEALLIGLSNSIHYFEKNAEALQLESKVENNVNFAIIEKFVKNYLNGTKKINTAGLKIILCVNPVNHAKQRVYFN